MRVPNGRAVVSSCLLWLACGEGIAELEQAPEPDTLDGVEQFVIPAVSDEVFIDKSLMIIDPSVVDSTLAQSKLDNPLAPGDGPWSFAHLVTSISGTLDPSAVAESLMVQLSTPQTVNGFPLAPLLTFTQAGQQSAPGEALRRWCRLADGRLDLTRAPFRLLAIVNRMDLRGATTEGGELRFIFNLLETDDTCALSADDTSLRPAVTGAAALEVIFELQQAVTSCSQARSVANAWRALAGRPFGGGYNSALSSLTRRTTNYRTSTRPNGSLLNQVRTNEPESFTLWFFKELRLGGTAPDLGTQNALQLVSPAAVPHFPSVDDSSALQAWVVENRPALLAGMNPPVPATFNGVPFGGAESATFIQRFRVGGVDATELNFQTCGGCHGTGAFGPHVGGRFGPVPVGRELGERAGLSTFLTGEQFGPPTRGELARRLPLLKALPETPSCGGLEVADAVPRFGQLASPLAFSPGETVWLNAIAPKPSSKTAAAVVKLYRVGDPDTAPTAASFTLPRTAARVTLPIPAPEEHGTWELRLFLAGAATSAARSAPFTTAPGVHYTVSNSSFAQRGMPTFVTWTAPADHRSDDRLEVHRVGEPAGAPISSIAIGAGTPMSTLDVSGTLQVVMPTLAGQYELRLYRGASTLLATGQAISVF